MQCFNKRRVELQQRFAAAKRQILDLTGRIPGRDVSGSEAKEAGILIRDAAARLRAVADAAAKLPVPTGVTLKAPKDFRIIGQGDIGPVPISVLILAAAAGLCWVLLNRTRFGRYVVATGGSAGGHLTAMVGLTANDPQYQPGFEDVDTSVRAMIPFYGVYEWDDPQHGNGEALTDILARYIVKRPYREAPEIYRSASPVHLVHADAPPALVIHGDRDTLAPVEEATGQTPVLAVGVTHEQESTLRINDDQVGTHGERRSEQSHDTPPQRFRQEAPETEQ